MRLLAILALSALIASGCDLPRDQRGSLDAARGGRLSAAIVGPDSIREAERGRLESFAQSIGATLDLRDLDTHEAIRALERTDIQIVAGLPKSTPFRRIGRSRAYRGDDGEERLWAVPPGENALLIAANRHLREGRP